MSKGLNKRERGLAIVVGALLVGGGLAFGGLRATGYIDSLDAQISQLEQELINLTQQNAQRSATEVAYRSVIADHSSDMTQEEIHDNLRREIFRLARVTIPGKDGAPSREMDLVKIPTLREGRLEEVGEGVLEYQIEFRVPRAAFQSVMHFLGQIENSTQLLRIDELDIARAPDGILVQSNFVITRTVLGRPEDGRESTSGRGDV